MIILTVNVLVLLVMVVWLTFRLRESQREVESWRQEVLRERRRTKEANDRNDVMFAEYMTVRNELDRWEQGLKRLKGK